MIKSNKDGYTITLNTEEEFEEFMFEGGWSDVDDWNQTIGVEFSEIKGKPFELVHNRIYIKEDE